MAEGRRKLFWWIWRLFAPFRRKLCLLCGGALLLSLLQAALVLLTRQVIDCGLAGEARFTGWAAALLAVTLLLILLRGGVQQLSGAVFDQESAYLQDGLLRAAQCRDLEPDGPQRSGAVLNRGIEDVKTLCQGVSGLLPGQAGSLARLLFAFWLLAGLAPEAAWLLLAGALLAGGGIALARPVLKRRQREVRREEENVSAHMQENLQQAELIRALGAEREATLRFRQALGSCLRAKRRRRIFSTGGHLVFTAFTQVGGAGLLLWGVQEAACGRATVGTAAALVQLFNMFRRPVQSLSGLWGQLAAMETAGEALRELLGEGQDKPETSAKLEGMNVFSAVFEHVTFCYPGDEEPALKNFSAKFDLTGWTCLTGVSGRGKSTVLKLLLALYRPQRGRIYLETSRGRMPCGADTRAFFAYVPQNYTLFSGSILENLLLAAPQADEARRRQALEMAQAQFVWELERQEETQLRENNAGLSMGQLQRLAIARAVLMDRQVLLLDECTSALDALTEHAVLQSLRRLGKGAVLITHRLEGVKAMEGLNYCDMEGKP